MSFLKEFSYSEIKQRKGLYLTAFILSAITGLIIADQTLNLQYYFFYSPVGKIIIIFSLGSFFFGNLLGHLLFLKLKNLRPLVILNDILLLLMLTVYISKFYLIAIEKDLILTIFFHNAYIITAYICFTALLLGIKSNYLIKVSCGDFIDERQGIIGMTVLALAGFPAGAAIAAAGYFYPWISFGFILFPILMIPAVFLLKLAYNPSPQFAKEFERETEEDGDKSEYRDFLIFMYLNFALIIIYLYLGHLCISRFNGNLNIHSLLYFGILFLFMAAGFILGGFIRKKLWHIYGQMFFPLSFLAFIFLLHNIHDYINIIVGIILFSPVSLTLGFVLRQSIDNIITNHKHAVRFRILEFSLFILPPPIILSLLLINFTNLWFFIVTYAVSLVSLLIPGLYLLSHKSRGYKKFIYFIFSLVFIPLLIILHVMFNIPMDENIYAGRLRNFNVLKGVNYDSFFIRQYDTVMMDTSPVFKVSDSIIRNMKRSLVPLALYLEENDQVLFIDGNQRFFQNPVIGMYPNARCLDLLSDDNVDYNRIPISGRQTYVTDNEDLIFYMRKAINEKKQFDAVIDVPNLLDQRKNYFRFSDTFYELVHKVVATDGIFGQIFSIRDCRAEFFSSAVNNLKNRYKAHAVYLFSDYCLILSSNNPKAFEINTGRYNRFSEFLKQNKMPRALFLNQIHVLSHLIFISIDDLVPYMSGRKVDTTFLIMEPSLPTLTRDLNKDMLNRESIILDCIPQTMEEFGLRASVSVSMAANKTGIDLLNRLEYAESIGDYDNETRYLFELQKYIPYRVELKEYVSQIFSYKEKYYYNTALRFEKEKKWEDAKKLYNVVLSMNSNNFDANYRLGLLYITLQDINNSYKYFVNAMKIKSDHPKVLYQMGVLYFMNNKTNEAIDYFNKALELKEINPSLFKYLALSYEKIGNTQKAEEYYSKAIVRDPGDTESKDRFDAIKKKKDNEINKWKGEERKNDYEVEQGVEMPLPINKSAYDIRLKDDDKSLPLLDSPDAGNATGGGK